MARKAMLGRKVRRLRLERKLSQVALAQRLGISASYLNLIEHDRRPLTLTLQMALADSLGIDVQSLSQDQDARLLAALRELFGDPLFGEAETGEEALRALVEQAPELGRAIVALYRGYRAARDDVVALGERLSADSFLSTSPHELRTLMTSVRSFSEILMDYDDLEQDKRRQFIGILVNETQRLSLIINQMLDYATGPDRAWQEGAARPADEVSDLVQERGNHFAELEEAAEAFRAEAGLGLPVEAGALLAALERGAGLSVRLLRGPVGPGALRRLDAEAGVLLMSDLLAPASRCFEMARGLALARTAPLLDELLDGARVAGKEARSLGREVMAGAFAAAVVMPYEAFAEAAAESRHDIEVLQGRFGVSFEQCCQRLASLNRPGARGLPFHFLRVDLAGNLSKRFTASGMPIARFGGLCPRMAVHQAFLTPGRIVTQLESMPDGSHYFDVARSVTKAAAGYREPHSHYAVTLGCESSFARDLVYADGLDLESAEAGMPVGLTCGLCERRDCGQRAGPLILPSLRRSETAEAALPGA